MASFFLLRLYFQKNKNLKDFFLFFKNNLFFSKTFSLALEK